MRSGRFGLLADAGELLEVVASVDEVETTPLVGGEGSEDKVGSECLASEGLPAFLKPFVHRFELRAHEGGKLFAGHGRHAGLARAGVVGGAGAAGESSTANDQELQSAVLHLPGFSTG